VWQGLDFLRAAADRPGLVGGRFAAKNAILSMRSPIRLVLLSAALLAAALAAQARESASLAKAPSILKPIQFIEYTLPNGLHVILHQNRQAPVVSTYVLYHVGSKNERADRTGFAHFFEHLMFEGSENIPRGSIDKYISGAGGNLNASTSFDQTDYYFNLPSNQLELALWIESERMLHAKVDETGVETQREVVKEERRLGVDNRPYGTLFEELAALIFRDTPYAWTPIGSVQYIDQAKIEEFREFYKTYYLPNNAVLAIAGDIDIEKTKALVEAYFGSIPKGPEPPRPDFKWDLAASGKRKDVVKENTPLPATLHGWRAVPETHPDAYPLEMLTNILSRGRSSRLYRKLVEEAQVAAAVDAFTFLNEKSGMVGVYARGQAGVELDKIDALISQEIAAVRKEGVSEDEFQKARNQQEADFATAFGSMSQRARNLARYHLFFGDANLINTELERYMKVTPPDLQRVAKEYFHDERVHVLRFPVPEKAAEPNAAAR
jgi:predicted Zn-dependent peptidase